MSEIAPYLSAIIGVVSVIIATLNYQHNKKVVEIQVRERIKGLEEEIEQIDKSLARETAELLRRIVGIEQNTSDIPVIKMQLGLFWKAVESHVPDLLLHPDQLERDVLLMKAKNRTLSQQEAVELKAILDVELQHLEEQGKETWPTFVFSVYCDYIARGIKPT